MNSSTVLDSLLSVSEEAALQKLKTVPKLDLDLHPKQMGNILLEAARNQKNALFDLVFEMMSQSDVCRAIEEATETSQLEAVQATLNRRPQLLETSIDEKFRYGFNNLREKVFYALSQLALNPASTGQLLSFYREIITLSPALQENGYHKAIKVTIDSRSHSLFDMVVKEFPVQFSAKLLYFAAEMGFLKAFKYIHDHSPSLIFEDIPKKHSLLHLVARSEYLDSASICQIILQHRPELCNFVSGYPRSTPLHQACLDGTHATIRVLVQAMDKKSILQRNNQQKTVLSVALEARRSIEMVNLLVEKNPALLYKTNLKDETCLHIAAEAGGVENLKYLLEKVPNLITAVDKNGDTALHYAKNAEVAKTLIEFWPPILTATNTLHKTPLHSTTKREVFDYLLSCNPDLINQKDSKKNNYLHMLATTKLTNEILHFVHKLNPNLLEEKNSAGNTPFHEFLAGMYYPSYNNKESVRSINLFKSFLDLTTEFHMQKLLKKVCSIGPNPSDFIDVLFERNLMTPELMEEGVQKCLEADGVRAVKAFFQRDPKLKKSLNQICQRQDVSISGEKSLVFLLKHCSAESIRLLTQNNTPSKKKICNYLTCFLSRYFFSFNPKIPFKHFSKFKLIQSFDSSIKVDSKVFNDHIYPNLTTYLKLNFFLLTTVCKEFTIESPFYQLIGVENCIENIVSFLPSDFLWI